MNKKSIAGKVFWFLTGAVTTLAVVSVIAAVELRSMKTIPLLRNWKYEYGDLRLVVSALPVKPDTFEAEQALFIYQGGCNRLTVLLDDAGNTTAITFNQDGWPLFDWQSHPEARVAQRTRYGGSSGEGYWDLDCDGQYDMKYVVENDEVEERYILVGGNWKQVDKADFRQGRAVLVPFQFNEFYFAGFVCCGT
jgi:hypothetical protein